MKGSVGSQTHWCSARYKGGIFIERSKGYWRFINKLTPLQREIGKNRATQRLTLAIAKDDYKNERYKPTVPFISLLADQKPSRFYTMKAPK